MSKNSYLGLNESKSATSDQNSSCKNDTLVEKPVSEKLLDKIINDLNNRINNNCNNSSKKTIMKRKSIMIESFNDESAVNESQKIKSDSSSVEKEEFDSNSLSSNYQSFSNSNDEETGIIDSETEFYESEYKQISKKHKAAAVVSQSFNIDETNCDLKEQTNNINPHIKIENNQAEKISDNNDDKITGWFVSNDSQSLRKLPDEATRIMKDWYDKHYTHPYPTDQERRVMAIKGKINESQVKAWFANKRNRSSNTKVKKQKLLLPKPAPVSAPTSVPLPQVVNLNTNASFTLPYANINQVINDSMAGSSFIFKNAAVMPNTHQSGNNKPIITFLAPNTNNKNNTPNISFLTNPDCGFINLSGEAIKSDQLSNILAFNNLSHNHRQIVLNNTSFVKDADKNRNKNRKKIAKTNVLHHTPILNNETIMINNNNNNNNNLSSSIRMNQNNKNLNNKNDNGSIELDFSTPNLILKNNQSSIANRLITNTCLQPFTTKASTIQNNFISLNENTQIQNNIGVTNYDYSLLNKMNNSSQQNDINNNNFYQINSNINIKSQNQSSDLLVNNCYFGSNSNIINNNNSNQSINSQVISSPSTNFIYTNDFYGTNSSNSSVYTNNAISNINTSNQDYNINENNHNYNDGIESYYCNCDCVINNSMATSNYQLKSHTHQNHIHIQPNRTPTHLNQQCNTPPPIITQTNNSTSISRCNSNENVNRKSSPIMKNEEQIDMQSFLNINSTTSQHSITPQDINNQLKQMYQVVSSNPSISSGNGSAFKSLNNTQNSTIQFHHQSPYYQQDFNDLTFQQINNSNNINNRSTNYIFTNENLNIDDTPLDFLNQIKHSTNQTNRLMNDSSSKFHNQFNYLMEHQDARFTDSKAKEWCISLHPRLSSTLLNLKPSHLAFKQFKNATRYKKA